MFKAVLEICDVVSHFITCPEDATIMLTLESNTNDYWIPSSKVSPGGYWKGQSIKDMQDIFGGEVNPDKILRMFRVWIPQHALSCVHHIVFGVSITGEQKKKSKNTYGKYRGKIRWVTEAELMRLTYQECLRSPEIMEFYTLSKTVVRKNEALDGSEIVPPSEYIYCGSLVELSDQVLVTGTSNIQEQVVEAAGFTKEVQCSLYREFLFMCFPALYLCQQIFSRFALELGWNREECPFLFRAADINSRGGISFRDFLYILAAIEPTTSHGGGPAEFRCRLIFRFFDRDKDNHLNYNEFKNLITVVRKSKKQTVDTVSVARDAEGCYKTMGFQPETHSLTISEFLHAVGDLKLRGTSQIFRSTIGVQQYLQTLSERESKLQARLPKTSESKMSRPALNIDSVSKSKANVPYAKTNDYELAVHTVKLQKSGTMINVDQIWNMDAAVTFSSTHQPTLSEACRRVSIDQFNQKSISNEVLKGLRYLTQVNKNKPGNKGVKKEQYSWGQLDSTQFAKHFITVCGQVKDIFKDEARMLDLSSPVYIMGDLHGNFGDLLYFEKVLWHLGPSLCPCNLLFLGDYVDRGLYSVEVISYLFCYKAQSPAKMRLLRGNHEIRDIQKMFTFYSECTSKFGEKLGIEVWNAVNNAFDMMPISAVIDGKVFCCHGGIPPPWLCPVATAINSVPIPLNQPDQQSSLAWEIMWNDPVRQKQLTEALAMELMANEGFAVNARRGTAHVFSVEALERFLNVNGFSHLIRAHEVAQAGFNVQQKGKLLTVFSSSKYCGGQNEAACILADQGKLRILRLETS